MKTVKAAGDLEPGIGAGDVGVDGGVVLDGAFDG